ncbi:MAG: hypothetical protein HQL59_06095 [Magnetococcales bacterium]|nr:hypothetical protein [Magnetococcales bacterium]
MRYHVIVEGVFPEETLAGLSSLSAILFRVERPVNPESMLKARACSQLAPETLMRRCGASPLLTYCVYAALLGAPRLA